MLSPLQIRARHQAVLDYDAEGRDGTRDLIETLRAEAKAERDRARDAARLSEQLRAVARAAGVIDTDERGVGLRLSVHDGHDPLEYSQRGLYRHIETSYDPDRFEDQPAGWDVGLWVNDQWCDVPEYDDSSFGPVGAFLHWMQTQARSAWSRCADLSDPPSSMEDVERLADDMALVESGRSDALAESAEWCAARADALEWRLLNPSDDVTELTLATDTGSENPVPRPAAEVHTLRAATALVEAAESGDLAPGMRLNPAGTWSVGDLVSFAAESLERHENTVTGAFRKTGVFEKPVKEGANNGKRGHDMEGRLTRLLRKLAEESDEQQARVAEVWDVVLALAE